jgi:hypothetical protein
MTVTAKSSRNEIFSMLSIFIAKEDREASFVTYLNCLPNVRILQTHSSQCEKQSARMSLTIKPSSSSNKSEGQSAGKTTALPSQNPFARM